MHLFSNDSKDPAIYIQTANITLFPNSPRQVFAPRMLIAIDGIRPDGDLPNSLELPLDFQA